MSLSGVCTSPSPDACRPSTTTHLPGLDGIRALAVIGVLLYHSDLPWFQGGFLGVDVFFVLSGFLITALLTKEIDHTRALDLRGFYLRRIRRLVPALALVLVSVTIAAAFLFPDAAPRVRADTLAALLYASNWWLVFSNASYFEFMGRPPLLQHLWSLAIEEQFYLVWPLCVLLCIRVAGRRGLAVVAAACALASTGWMHYLAVTRGYPDLTDPSRIYLGTDTHCMGLLVGAAIAAIWQPWRSTGTLSRGSNVKFGLLGALTFAAVMVAFLGVGEQSPTLYRGGFLALSFVVGALVVAASHPDATFGTLLGRQPLRWIGTRSYGLYMWHWPVFVLTRPGLDLPLQGGANLGFRLALTALIAEASYRLVERPIRDGAIARFLSAWRGTRPELRRPLVWRAATAAVLMAGSLVLAGVGLAVTPGRQLQPGIAPDVAAAVGIQNGGPTRVTITREAPPSAAKAPPLATPSPVATVAGAAASLQAAGSGTDADLASPRSGLAGDTLTAVGDSVLLGTRRYLERSIPGARTDAEVGRQAQGVLARLRELRASQLLAPKVLLHLGTNGYITEKQLRQALGGLGDRQRIIVVNAHAPRRWVAPNNALIQRVIPEYSNATLARWAEISQDHPEFFVSDGVHLTASGQRAFVGEVIRAGGFPPPFLPALWGAGPPVSGSMGRLKQGTMSKLRRELWALSSSSMESEVEDWVPESSGPLIRLPRPMALDVFWQSIARCETGGNWSHSGRFSGGLGIYVGSWKTWGGQEFAPTPAAATREQQIVVANRISTQGWTRPDSRVVSPVGFSGWGCLKVVGHPSLVSFEPDSVVRQPFRWGQRGDVVKDLQAILGARRDGVYGQETWTLHVWYLEARRWPRFLAP